MPEQRISDLFDVQARYLRSINLERDFENPRAMSGYVLTPDVRGMISRIQESLEVQSSQRAWRVTGDYGSGKSSFALLLAHLVSGRKDDLPSGLRKSLASFRTPTRLMPVLVTGSRSPLSTQIAAATLQALQEFRSKGPAPKAYELLEEVIERDRDHLHSNQALLTGLIQATEYLSRTERFDGLLIVLDELGKSLEQSAMRPEQQDVMLLQNLAEVAARSGKRPIVIVGLLHQGFHAYSDTLSQATQREWEKVAGRFDELLLAQPVDQLSLLMAEALRVRVDRMPRALPAEAASSMRAALDLDWFGPGANRSFLVDLAARLYPLHPTVIPALIQVFRRFGQNERSLFSFLLSTEPFGLRWFAERSLQTGEWFRLTNLYDYTRAAFGHRLSLQSYRSHWLEIDAVIETYPTVEPADIELLKTVGLLNLIDHHALRPTEALLRVAWRGSEEGSGALRRAMDRLTRRRSVLYFRGRQAGYCLWPHTSVNLERAFEEATKAAGNIESVSEALQSFVESRPIVARRHYIESGNLRHFSVKYVPALDLEKELKDSDTGSSDGRIVIAMCDTEQQRAQALKLGTAAWTNAQRTLLAVPRPLNALARAIQLVQRCDWVMTNTPELNHDRYAANEVSLQYTAAVKHLQRSVAQFVGLGQADRPEGLRWFYEGQAIQIRDGKELLQRLSRICESVFSEAPQIKNELINRSQLSSAAAAARMRLIEHILADSGRENLGLPVGKRPPEYSMYLSVLASSKLHRIVAGEWTLSLPSPEDDCCNIRPVLLWMVSRLRGASGRRVNVKEVLEELKEPPFGLKQGLGFLFLAVVVQLHEQDLALYENGSFLKEMTGEDFLRIVKEPEAFELQFYEMSAVRRDLFRKLSEALHLGGSADRSLDILDVVRPLCVLASKLPHYTQRTASISKVAQQVRAALLDAREPGTLLFEELPQAVGLSAAEAIAEHTEEFVRRLQTALDELRSAYPSLLLGIGRSLGENFAVAEIVRERTALRGRAEAILLPTTEPKLRAFCGRIADVSLDSQGWLEGIASLLCAKPPSKWLDRDVELFDRELNAMCRIFTRVESLAFAGGRAETSAAALRVSITGRGGDQVDRVVFLSSDDDEEREVLERKIADLLVGSSGTGQAALAKVFWRIFQSDEVNQ